MSYWDTSALAKLYVVEGDSGVFESRYAASTVAQTTSRLSYYEVLRTLEMKAILGGLNASSLQTHSTRFKTDVVTGRFRLIELSEQVEQEFESVLNRCFSQNPAIHIRTMDAIHLASAIAAGETELVCTDKRLRDAALRCGLAVFPA